MRKLLYFFLKIRLKKMLCFRFPDRLVKICADCNFFSAQKKKKKSATDPVQRFRFLSKVKTISLREFVRADFRIFSVFSGYVRGSPNGKIYKSTNGTVGTIFTNGNQKTLNVFLLPMVPLVPVVPLVDHMVQGSSYWALGRKTSP